MNYYNLKSILSAGKSQLPMLEAIPSFSVTSKGTRTYIEPSFQKVVFETERPTVLLVSALGATGKTALAEQLSKDTRLPLLDLSKHKPVGDSTLTGLLTSAFAVEDIGAVFKGIASGGYGVIIDGVDEGRSKTTEKGFEAFLDDIAKLCPQSQTTTFVMLGRTQVVEDCWLYLSGKGIRTGLITISPFSTEEAKRYIDAFTGGLASSHSAEYVDARDAILDRLGRAFTDGASAQHGDFLSFIGYPPVLDAIVTLLLEEKNYHALLSNLGEAPGKDVEISLLYRIASYILAREREQKVLPNFLEPLLEYAPVENRQGIVARAYTAEEQCVRLVNRCLGRDVQLCPLGDRILDEKYETHLSTFLPEHPFLLGRQFRNVVFEALALATLAASRDEGKESLLSEYVRSHKHSYHLVYMLDSILPDRRISLGSLGPLFGAAMEFRSVHSTVEMRIDGADWDSGEEPQTGDLEVEIDILAGADQAGMRTFSFRAEVEADSCILLGPRLAGAFISVPCRVKIAGPVELEMMPPIEISARAVELDAKGLVLRPGVQREGQQEVIIRSDRLQSGLETITANGIALAFILSDMRNVSYPLIQYTTRISRPPADPLLRQKYFRLRRILMEFRSHSRGALGRYKGKIENERVLKSEVGRAVLGKLVADHILSLRDEMYFLDPAQLSAHVGVSWQDLRRGLMPDSVERYIRGIP